MNRHGVASVPTVVLSLVMLGGMLWYMDSAVLIGWFAPLLTIVPLMYLCRNWFARPFALGLGIYGLSIVSGILAMEVMGMGNQQSAELSGFVFPVAYAFILLCLHLLLARAPKAGAATSHLRRLLGGVPETAAAVGGAAAGAVVGAFFGGVSYYVWDEFILIELFLGEESALNTWVLFCTLSGIGQGALEGHKLGSSAASG